MRQIVYLSIAAIDLKGADWTNIIDVSQRRNVGVAVTGLLLFDGAHFIQALEEPEAEAFERWTASSEMFVIVLQVSCAQHVLGRGSSE